MFRPLKSREYKQVLLFTMISKQPDKNKRLILITQTQCFSEVNKNMLLGSFPKTHIVPITLSTPSPGPQRVKMNLYFRCYSF